MSWSKTRGRNTWATSLLAASLTGITMMSACRSNVSTPQPLTPVRTSEVQAIDAGTSNT